MVGTINVNYLQTEQHKQCYDCECTVKYVLTTTTEQRPPVDNSQPKYSY